MKRLNNTVLVTGGANGIGNAIARKFLDQGCNVIIADIDKKAGLKFGESNPNAYYIEADLSKTDKILNIFSFIDSHWSTLDVLINNVGISKFKPLLELSVEDWDNVLNTNLRSAFICSREFAHRHSKGTYGRIINIASTRHLMSEPNGEAYAASKGGLVSLTHALAASMQDIGMTVNCISPGWIHAGDSSALNETDKIQHLTKRVGTPDDIANFCHFLCQSENDFITGQNFYVDGGMTKKMIYEE